MRIKMLASMRAFTLMGLDLLEKQTKAASREASKAMLPTMDASVQLGRISSAREQCPMGEEASAVWDVPLELMVTYRDALVMFAHMVQKTLEREKEARNDDAAHATQAQLEDLGTQLRDMGDQRDIFADGEDEEDAATAKDRQMELV